MKPEKNKETSNVLSAKGPWTAARLRRLWTEYFLEKEHTAVPSASLVPTEDPTLLFTSAGMVPFKDHFSGHSKPPWKRVSSIQKCLRTTDLDSVGKTERHCSFFEMLGNFSFGDYFKREAIQYAWEFSLHYLKLQPERIYVTVFMEDDEAERIWHEEIGLPLERIRRLGTEDNWWGPAGDQGPCGPCSELYLDRTEDICKTCRCENKSKCAPGGEGERFMEYWNLVFNEFYRDPQGGLRPLSQKGVDTGAGLERILALLEDKESIYETSELQQIITAITTHLNTQLRTDQQFLQDTKTKTALRVLSDHLRAVVFSISDGIFPANTGRGYVIRRIIRRALLYARDLGIFEPILHRLVDEVTGIYGEFYPELKQSQANVKRCLLAEERRFLETLELGLRKWNELLAEHRQKKAELFSGRDAFLLYDTYGFPLELSREMAAKADLKIEQAGFDEQMQSQRERSAKSMQWSDISLPALNLRPTAFIGYDSYEAQAQVQAIIQDSKSVQSCRAGTPAMVILDQSPFYAEGGGQVGDTGQLVSEGDAIFAVEDTQKSGSLILHIGHLKSGQLQVGTKLKASIDSERREGLRRHHSATHLLNHALSAILGDHVIQTGSLVAPDHLRFDFSHPEKISPESLAKISSSVNAAIAKKKEVEASIMPLEEARQAGALATFGEKYGEEVRVIAMGSQGELSLELCGGCHVKNTADIGFFHITKESSPGAGNRRIEAVAGEDVRQYFRQEWEKLYTDIGEHNQKIQQLAASQTQPRLRAQLLGLEVAIQKSPSQDIIAELKKPQDVADMHVKLSQARLEWEAARKQKLKLEKTLSGLSAQDLIQQAEQSLAKAQRLGPLRLICLELDGQEIERMRRFTDRIKERGQGMVVLLGSRTQKGATLLFSADKAALKCGLNMADIIREAAQYIQGGGGGRPDMAQAGGKKTEGLDTALKCARERIENSLSLTSHS